MSITTTTMLDAYHSSVQTAAPTSDLSLNNEKTLRTAYDATVTNIQYYIQVDANINQLIFYKNNNITGGETDNNTTDSSGDDIWGMKGLTLNSGNTVKNLPTFTNKEVLIKKVSLYSVNDGSHNNFSYNLYKDGTFIGTAQTVTSAGLFYSNAFDIKMKMSSNSYGVINSVSTLYYNNSAFDSIRFSAGEELDFAQTIGFDYDTAYSYTAPGTETHDTLYFDLSDSMLNSNGALSTKLSAVNSLYNNTNMISSFSIAFDAVTASDHSVIAKHARAKGWDGSETGTYFSAGEKIVTDTAYSLSLTMRDGLNQEVVLFWTIPIYGVFNHSNSISNNNMVTPSPEYET
jgi:hypothetical protein